MELRTRDLFRLHLDVGSSADLGNTPFGHRRIITVSGGGFEGERLRGVVLPDAAADWAVGCEDGSTRVEVRATLRTDDGALIYMSYRGIVRASNDVLARFARGESVDPAEYYIRMTPSFETGHSDYTWLNRIVSIGLGERLPGAVRYDVLEVL